MNAPPAGLPRLLTGIDPDGPLSLQSHVHVHGPLPHLPRARRRSSPLIEELERAGLLGRGGAGFPAANKLRAVIAARGRPIVLVNGVEAEPLSEKDRALLERLPHLVLDGAVLSAAAVGADEVIVAVRESLGYAAESVERAIGERDGITLTLAVVPDAYLAGQETALASYLSGGQLRPTFTPPRPAQQGVDRRPTLVNNVETLAHVALIARHGAGWFRALGTEQQPGSGLVTVAGAVRRPGVYEIAYGSPLRGLLDAAGGVSEPVQGVLVGGYAGAWLAAERIASTALDDASLAAAGAAMLAGVIFVLAERACAVRETAELAGWMASQSSRQCGPCVHGLDALAGEIAAVAEGYGARQPALRRIDRLASLTAGRGACGHPDGAVNALLSALRTFAPQFEQHARHGACAACARPGELVLPSWRLPEPLGGRARVS